MEIINAQTPINQGKQLNHKKINRLNNHLECLYKRVLNLTFKLVTDENIQKANF